MEDLNFFEYVMDLDFWQNHGFYEKPFNVFNNGHSNYFYEQKESFCVIISAANEIKPF